jgi:hypothetical protein
VDHVQVIPFRPHRTWPVQFLLMLWRWLPDLVLMGLVVWFYVAADAAGRPFWVTTLALVLMVGLVMVPPMSRRILIGTVLLLVTRHRLRTYFVQAGAYNRSGRLPWVTFSRPTVVGERVWVWLVPGLSMRTLEAGVDEIAVACWARSVRVGRSTALANLVWIDVIRRDPLTGSRPLTSTLLDAWRTTHHSDAATVGAADRHTAPVNGRLGVPRIPIDLDALVDAAPTTRASSNGNGRGSSTSDKGNGAGSAGTSVKPPAQRKGGSTTSGSTSNGTEGDLSEWL